MRYIAYNAKSDLASFIFQGFEAADTVLVPLAERPVGVLGRVGRVVESLLPRTRLGLYPQARARVLLRQAAPADAVVFFAIENTRNVANLMKYVAARDIHVFLWNPVARLKQNREDSLRQIDALKRLSSRISISTFDAEDADAYGLKLAPQPYRHVAPLAEPHDLHDFYFSGVDKGRLPLLLQLRSAIEALGLRSRFHIVGDSAHPYTAEQRLQLQDGWIPYAENLRISQQSRCLVEIVQQHQSGPTLRSMEALFLNRKIVTNRRSARDDAFFDPRRVLLIDGVDARQLHEFMCRPHRPVPPALLQPHEIHAWVEQLTRL